MREEGRPEALRRGEVELEGAKGLEHDDIDAAVLRVAGSHLTQGSRGGSGGGAEQRPPLPQPQVEREGTLAAWLALALMLSLSLNCALGKAVCAQTPPRQSKYAMVTAEEDWSSDSELGSEGRGFEELDAGMEMQVARKRI